MIASNKSIGVFIDGGYYAKINEGFKGMAEVNLKALLNFIPKKISEIDDIDRNELFITECHYYRGRYRVRRKRQETAIFGKEV